MELVLERSTAHDHAQCRWSTFPTCCKVNLCTENLFSSYFPVSLYWSLKLHFLHLHTLHRELIAQRPRQNKSGEATRDSGLGRFRWNKNVIMQPWKQNTATCRIKEHILKVFSIKHALLLPCVSLPWASAVLSTGNYLVLRCCVRHFADAKGHMNATSSVWPWSMQHCSISLVSLYLHYGFESPRGASEI